MIVITSSPGVERISIESGLRLVRLSGGSYGSLDSNRIARCGDIPLSLAISLMGSSYRDRSEAGQRLAGALSHFAGDHNALVLALPRGGVPVGYEVAQALHLPLEVMVVRKLGVPGQEELAMGAIASGGVRVISEDVVHALSIPERSIAAAAANEERELERQERAFRGDRPFPDVRSKTVILTDDGLATGATMKAAVVALRAQRPGRLVIAVPVAPNETCMELKAEVDEVICGLTPDPFIAVGQAYQSFPQISDEEVRQLLQRSSEELGTMRRAG